MGRAPCCDKANVKKGPWSPEEDAKLKSYIEQHGTGGNWIALPQKIGLKRCGKSCRLRWLNYLRPNLKHGGFSEEEDNIICSLYISIGSRWSIIAAQLPGRTDNDIKNYWNTRLKKKLLGKQRKEQQQGGRRGKRGVHNNSSSSINVNPVVPSSSAERDYINYPKSNPYNWAPDHQPPAVVSPIPYANQEPGRLNDHTSIRKLLIKLGGRFSDENHVFPPIHNPAFSYQSLINDATAFANQVYEQHQPTQSENGMGMLQGQSSNFGNQGLGEEMGLMMGNQGRLDGLEFLLGDDEHRDEVVISNEKICLDEGRSMVHPGVASYEEMQLQEYGLNELL